MRDKGLEIIAVALDTTVEAAVGAKIRAEDCKHRPDMVARLMAFGEELWNKQSRHTTPCLIDENHTVGVLYGMGNVPQAVWIDESGCILRPAESAGTIDMARHLNRETVEIPDELVEAAVAARSAYVDALRDRVFVAVLQARM